MLSKPRVLFFSTGDSTRSRMAETFMRKFAGEQIAVACTAVQSVDYDPLAGAIMKEEGLDLSASSPKGVSEALKEHFSYVVTVYDSSRERHPVWPFCHNLVQWDLVDPEQIPASTRERSEIYRNVRDQIRHNVRLLLAQILPRPAQ
jgi:arsenate reductase (thioredoxin)